MDAERVLIIILSVTLTVFLMVAIALAVQLLKVSKKLQAIADKAEGITDNLVEASRVVKNAAQPAVISGAIVSLVNKLRGKPRRK